MDEREFEEIIVKHPELIEDNLTFIGKQVYLEGKYLDVLFQYKNGEKVIVELKLIANRKDVAQLFDYAGYFIDNLGTPIRTILVANRIPLNFRKSLDYYGIEYKEISVDQIKTYLPETASAPLAVANAKDEKVHLDFANLKSSKNETRQSIANNLKRNKFSKQARFAYFLLKDNEAKAFTMKEIKDCINSKGYKSKSYYDLLNAFVDSELVEFVFVNGRKAYKLKK